MSIEEQILRLREIGYSFRSIGRELGIPKSTVWDTWVRAIKAKHPNTKVPKEGEGPVVAFIDVEVTPSIVLAFGRNKQFIPPDAVLQEPYMLTFGYCLLNNPDNVKVHKLTDYDMWELDHQSDFELILDLVQVLNAADIVIAHNAKFDKGWLNQRCAYWNIDPPSPYKVICTLQQLKRHFNLPSNSLAASSNYFELPAKRGHDGISLWRRCLEGDEEAIEEMAHYNEGDLPGLVELYKKIRPFMNNHPNLACYYDDTKVRCNNCGSENVKHTGRFTYTNLSKFEIIKCEDCKAYGSTRTTLFDKDKRKSLMRGNV